MTDKMSEELLSQAKQFEKLAEALRDSGKTDLARVAEGMVNVSGILVEVIEREEKEKGGAKVSEKEEFRSMARQFRAFGNILCVRGTTFHEKLNGAIAIGLAEVCELLSVESSQILTAEMKRRGFARMGVVEEAEVKENV